MRWTSLWWAALVAQLWCRSALATEEPLVVRFAGLQGAEVHFGPVFRQCDAKTRPGAARVDFAGLTDDYYDVMGKSEVYLSLPARETFEVVQFKNNTEIKKQVRRDGRQVFRFDISRGTSGDLRLTPASVTFEGDGKAASYSLIEPVRISKTVTQDHVEFLLDNIKLKPPGTLDEPFCLAGARPFSTAFFSVKITTTPEQAEIWLDGKRLKFKSNTTLRFPESNSEEVSLVIRRPGYATAHRTITAKEQEIDIKLNKVDAAK